MTREEAEARLRQISTVVTQLFNAAGGIHMMLHYEGDRGEIVLKPPGVETDREAIEHVAIMRELLRQDNARWVVLISEAWILAVQPGQKPPLPVSKQPGREEVVTYQWDDVHTGPISACQRIIRPKRGKPHLDELFFASASLGGLFHGLLPGHERRYQS